MQIKFLLTGFSSTFLSLLTFTSNAQPNKVISTADSLFSGVWKGTSICQVKNSPCHDENVVYYISKVNKDLVIEMDAYKIVNGKEEEMGKIQFQYDANTKQITSIAQSKGIWNFKREKNSLKGTLYVNDALYRIVDVTKK
jgi:hypothetical protein